MDKVLEALRNPFGASCENGEAKYYYTKEQYEAIEKELKAYYELESMHEELAKAYNKLCQEKLEWRKSWDIVSEYVDVFQDTNGIYYMLLNGYGIPITEEQYNVLKEAIE